MNILNNLIYGLISTIGVCFGASAVLSKGWAQFFLLTTSMFIFALINFINDLPEEQGK